MSIASRSPSRELRTLAIENSRRRRAIIKYDEARLSQLGKKVPNILAAIAATSGKPLELWFQDEARIGQKNNATRRWVERGTRPFALKDQRTLGPP
jgi:hypothetical protein